MLAEKLETLRSQLRDVRKTFDNELGKLKVPPIPQPVRTGVVTEREFAAGKTYEAHRDVVEALFDFRTLDPAMGSGHFLVEAVDFITDRMLTFLNQFPVNPVSFMLDRTRQNILAALTEQGVSVDPDKLTEVNLLKRHVLKRCIYGVDLNPMAVELAKVSLWLDAFTIGAPLSFLDHHLRCGNSLIGATFKDLEAATKGQLFSIDYEPLLRAIRHVIQVNQMADATAAEVKHSASEYGKAREDLSGYQVVLDLLVARHFDLPKAAGLLAFGNELDLNGRTKFLESLRKAAPTKKGERPAAELVTEVEDLARRADRRFFHWEVEFPEVYFSYADAEGRQIRHKHEIGAGTAGFDTIVGNPPYVRQESIKPFKSFLQSSFATFDSTNDLYVYFQEQEVRNLRVGGRMAMIVANKWMRAGYGVRLRGYLRRVAQPIEIVDFGHSPIFPEADTFPCILIAERRAKALSDATPLPASEAMSVASVPRDDWSDKMDLRRYVAPRRQQIPTQLLRDEGWSLENPGVQALLEKIRNTGVPLREYCGSSPVYGIKTGFNEAFVIDEATRTRLIKEDKRSAEIIKPLLRGRDIDRWRPRESGLYLIFARRGIEIDRYPAIKRHFSQFRKQLEPKPDHWDAAKGKWPGRAAGDYEWYELQASPGEDFERALSARKILYQEIQFHSWFSLEVNGAFVNNKVFLLPSDDLMLLGILASSLLWWQFTRILPHMKDEALSPSGYLMEDIRIATGSDAIKGGIRSRVDALVELSGEVHNWEAATASMVRSQFDLETDRRLFAWLALPTETFTQRIANFVTDQKLSGKTTATLASFQRRSRAEQVALLTRQLDLERQLATLVEDAFALTPDERTLLHATRPIRDPLDVLEARIRGKEIAGEGPAEPSDDE